MPEIAQRDGVAVWDTANLSVINQAISGGRVTGDGIGPSTLNRVEQDVLAQPNLGGVIFLQGINDLGTAILQGPPKNADEVIAAYRELADRVHAAGVPIYIGTLTPAGNLARPAPYGLYSSPMAVADRNKINEWLRTEGRQVFDGVIDFDEASTARQCLYFADRRGLPIGHRGWQSVRELLDWLTDHWDQPEEGIWETRGGRKPFTYGRLMCWVAFDRGIRLAASHGRPAAVAGWTAARDAIYDQIMEEGWNTKRQAFVQHYGSDVLDSSLLRMATVGFISPYDPMWASTLRAMDEELVTDSLVYRYDPSASPDGLQGSEGTFSLCSFMYVDALARAGRLDDARLALEKMLTYANHVGLYSEEVALTGEQIGNFPQAFTHLALIDAEITLNEALDRAAPPAPPRPVADEAAAPHGT